MTAEVDWCLDVVVWRAVEGWLELVAQVLGELDVSVCVVVAVEVVVSVA